LAALRPPGGGIPLKWNGGQASLAKYAGLAWSKYQSGDFGVANTKRIVSGNKYLKYYLLEVANKVRLDCAESARYCLKKFGKC